MVEGGGAGDLNQLHLTQFGEESQLIVGELISLQRCDGGVFSAIDIARGVDRGAARLIAAEQTLWNSVFGVGVVFDEGFLVFTGCVCVP